MKNQNPNQETKKQKKFRGYWVGIYFGFLILTLGFLMLGCGGSTTATTTTSTTTTSTTTGTGSSTSTTSTTTTTQSNQVANPTFSQASGSLEANSMMVTIECETTGASIYYTINGSTPSASSTLYSTPFTIEVSTVIKAIATKATLTTSEVTSTWYDLYWWQALNNGLDNTVLAMVVDSSGNLYVGGSFTSEAGPYITKWTGTTWETLGTSFNERVLALAFNANESYLYVGGLFTQPFSYIAKYSSGWGSNGTLTSNVRAVALSSGNTVYAGGDFNALNYAAKYENQSWITMGGLSQPVYCFALDGSDNVYAGGAFTGGVKSWNGSTWSSLANGISGGGALVYTLTFDSSGDLYAGGDFTTAGDVTVNKIAKWDSSATTWEALDNGLYGNVFSLAFDSSDNLYAGLVTPEAGSLGCLGKWDGSTWTTVGNGMNGSVYAVAYDSTNDILYAGGDFTTAGGITAECIAKWAKK